MSTSIFPFDSPKNGETRIGPDEEGFEGGLTSQVIGATGPKAHPRLASILPSLVKHVHAFMRECEITNHELMAAFNLV